MFQECFHVSAHKSVIKTEYAGQSEREVLFPAGTKFRLLKYEQIKDYGLWEAKMKVIGSLAKPDEGSSDSSADEDPCSR